LAKSAQDLADTGSEHDHAAAENFAHDSRVGDARAIRFSEWCRRTDNDSTLRLAAEEYLREQVRKSPDETFLHSDNAHNRIGYGGGGGVHIAKDDPLATVLDLTGLAGVLRGGRLAGLPELQDLPAAAAVSDDQINRYFDGRLGNPDNTVRDRTVQDVLEAIRLAGARHPSWASPWDRFMNRIDATPESWLAAVGLPRATYPRWVIVLRYTVGEAGFLVRPTQLEAGWFGFHFPSPAMGRPDRGGHAMSLSDRPAGQRLPILPELIHPQVRFRVHHWRATGRMCGVTSRVVGPLARLPEYRRAHRDDLTAEYGAPALVDWMTV